MTQFEHRLLLVLSQGEMPAQSLYDIAKDPTRVRKVLKSLIERGWVKHTRSEKRSSGPGAPMKYFELEELGEDKLANHESELAQLRGDV